MIVSEAPQPSDKVRNYQTHICDSSCAQVIFIFPALQLVDLGVLESLTSPSQYILLTFLPHFRNVGDPYQALLPASNIKNIENIKYFNPFLHLKLNTYFPPGFPMVGAGIGGPWHHMTKTNSWQATVSPESARCTETSSIKTESQSQVVDYS